MTSAQAKKSGPSLGVSLVRLAAYPPGPVTRNIPLPKTPRQAHGFGDLRGVAAVAAAGRVGALSSTSFARPDQKDRLFQELRQADAEPPARKEGIGVLVVPEAGRVEHWREDPP